MALVALNGINTSDIGAIWKAAVEHYEKTTNVKLSSVRANDVNQILAEIKDKNERFELYRHDGSKLDKFRTLVKSSLDPIEKLGDIVAQATNAVRKRSSQHICGENLLMKK